jgi:hypothetical protein
MTAHSWLRTPFSRKARPTVTRPRARPRARLHLEALEERELLAINLPGDPIWTPAGPGPTNFGTARLNTANINLASNGTQADLAGGAINAVAVDPNNSATLLAGAAGGGIWRSTDNGASWTAETDQFASLAITSIAYSPGSSNVVFASTGNVSAGYPPDLAYFSTQAAGVLRSSDGGVTWTQLDPTDFGGRRLNRVVPTGFTDPGTNQQVVLAAAMDRGGIYRSTNNGASWTNVLPGDPAGAPSPPFLRRDNLFGADLIRDPAQPGRYFAAIPGSDDPTAPGSGEVCAVFRSDDYGATWTNLDPAGPGIEVDAQSSGRILLALSSGNAGFALYAEVITSGHLTNLYRSTDAGTAMARAATWRPDANAQDPFPGGQGGLHGAIVADPGNPQVVYVSGDTIPEFPFTGNIYQVNATGGPWKLLSLGKTSIPNFNPDGSGPGGVLTEAVDNLTTSTTLNVVAASAFPVDSDIQVDNEVMLVTGRDTTTNTLDVTRNFDGRNIAAHTTASPVLLTTSLTMCTFAGEPILNVRNAAAIPDKSIIQIGDELMQVTARDLVANTLTVNRAFNGSSVNFHFVNDPLILVTNGATNTAPHADSRVMVFHNGNILQGGDGGLYELTGLGATPTWVSRMGNLQVTQFYSAALDPAHRSILGAAQDNATEFLVNGTGAALNPTWTADRPSGDGIQVAVDQAGVWPGSGTATAPGTVRCLVRTGGQAQDRHLLHPPQLALLAERRRGGCRSAERAGGTGRMHPTLEALQRVHARHPGQSSEPTFGTGETRERLLRRHHTDRPDRR